MKEAKEKGEIELLCLPKVNKLAESMKYQWIY
jgi:hypothetical protein